MALQIRSSTIVFVLIAFLIATASVAQAQLVSRYTSLDKPCQMLEEGTAKSPTTTRQCRGLAGYKLVERWDDGHFDVTVVSPQGKKFYLNFGVFITPRFSDPGGPAEWRLKQVRGK